jgi:head-tail adaptor
MQSGKLRHLCQLQYPTYVPDSFGTPIKTWNDDTNGVVDGPVVKTWMSIDPASMASMRGASETILAGAETPVDLAIITLRPRDDIDTTWRVLYGVKIYDLKAVRQTNRNDEMTFFAAIGASDG